MPTLAPLAPLSPTASRAALLGVLLLAAQAAPRDPAPQEALVLPPAERLVPVPAEDVHLSMFGFWGPRVAANLLVTLRHGADELEEHGQFGNFRLAAAALGHGQAPVKADGSPCAYSGVHYYDSDAYKWLEAACLALAQDAPSGVATDAVAAAKADLRARIDRFVEEIAAAQRDDGYIQTQYVVKGQTPFSKLGSDHELYCAGHLIQAAIAHQHATGSSRLLDVALRFADLLARTFGDDAAAGQKPGCCGHPEIETALVQLAHATGEKRWLDLAAYFLDQRGKGLAGGDEYRQDGAPIREQRTAAGHAVRQLYLCSGALGVAAETGDRALLQANRAVWNDIVQGKLYVTGGLGSRPDGEAFGAPFELPNDRAYSETCASVAWMRWNRELLAASGEARFGDALETTLYNAFLAGLGLDGKSFFYVNPLQAGMGVHREPWYGCACCPPNVMRTLAGLPGWFASTSHDTLWLQLYDECTLDASLGDGRKVRVAVETKYPWDGRVRVRFVQAPQGTMTLALRLPGWARPADTTAEVVRAGGRASDRDAVPAAAAADGWLRVARTFADGDVVELHLPFDVVRLAADARVLADAGRLALRRGPLVYAFESLDQPDPLSELCVDGDGPVEIESTADLGGIRRLVLTGAHVAPAADGALYGPTPALVRAVSLRAIPYYAWANRGDAAMSVWMPAVTRVPSFADDVSFLRRHADALVLRADDGGPVVVSPRLSGRVMTSAFADDEPGFGLVCRGEIDAGPGGRPFANYGGEDRLWLSPEGGPWGLFFDADVAQVPEHWAVPAFMDGGPRTATASDGRSVSFGDVLRVERAGAAPASVRIDRRIEALARSEVSALLGRELPSGVRVVAFRSINRASWADAPPAGDALLGLWVLGQFVPDDSTRVLFPFRGDPAAAIKRDYFGVVPDDRLAFRLPASVGASGVARFTADSRLRSKIGLSRAGATGWIGAFDAERRVLTLVNHTLPAAGASVPDCDWKVPNPHAAQGDVAASYDNGTEPRFFELESLSAALPREPGAALEHVHTTIHLGGDRVALAEIAKAVLHADL